MDVLFGSIDVRDLLSSHDSEESSPLSAPHLRLLIDRLQVRSLHIKDKVCDYVLSHRHDFADIFSRCSHSVSRTESLSSDLSRALQLLSDGQPLDVEIRDLAVEIISKRRELEERKEALAVVGVVSALLERLRTAKGDLLAGRLVQAAESVRDLKAALLIEEAKWGLGGDGDQPIVFELLRKDWMQCFDELQEVLTKMVEKAVQFDPENGVLRVNSQLSMGEMDNLQLETVLEALDVVGVLDYGLAKVADLIVKHVMKPIISNGFVNISIEELYQDTKEKPRAILKLVQSSDFQGNQSGASIYSRVLQTIKFIHKFVLYENGKWMGCFGRLTWSRISDLVITFFLSKAVPDDASKIAEFQNIIKCTAEFEASLKEMMFISRIDGKEEKLSLFAHNVEVHFASKKRNEILARARNLVLQCNFIHAPESILGGENFVDLLFQPDRCIISKAAVQLMELVHQTLKDVCLSPTRVAMEFYHAARDALLLYKAIAPAKLEKQIETISQAAIILHNDCLYLSQEIAGLAFQYRSDFPNGVKGRAVFIDMAPYFRQLAEDVLQKQVQHVNFNLKEAIDGANGYQNTHQMQQYELAKFSIDQVIFILEKVHIIWEPLLPKSTYKRSMNELLDSVFSRITNDILLLDDLAAEETLQLQRLIHMIIENASSLIGSLLGDSSGTEYSNKLLPSLPKLRKLADMLDMPLKSITALWESGELVDCGFTASEVENFIKSIFTDSPLRKDCLWRIGSVNS